MFNCLHRSDPVLTPVLTPGADLELRSMDVVVPTPEAGEIRLRVIAKPDKPLAQLLIRLGIELPNVPKAVENVVPKMA